MNRIIIFTDLDGTLLDAENYSFTAAQDALNMLIRKNIPIIPCTSKTHLEVIEIQKKVGISDPFIVENGSAIFFPKGYFMKTQQPFKEIEGYQSLILGREYKDILNFFYKWRENYDLKVTGVHEMPVEKVMELTALNYDEAETVKKRFFSEPFILNGDKNLPAAAVEEITRKGFRLLVGNRFYHLLGNSDKGTAVNQLLEMFKRKWKMDTLISIGIGDSMNDLEMLKAVDRPAIVKKPTGRHEERIKMDNLMQTEGIGPAGWQEAVFRFSNVE